MRDIVKLSVCGLLFRMMCVSVMVELAGIQALKVMDSASLIILVVGDLRAPHPISMFWRSKIARYL